MSTDGNVCFENSFDILNVYWVFKNFNYLKNKTCLIYDFVLVRFISMIVNTVLTKYLTDSIVTINKVFCLLKLTFF
jgi:hypothetical protein